MKSTGKQQPAELSSDVPPSLLPHTYSAKSVSILLPICIRNVFSAGIHTQFKF